MPMVLADNAGSAPNPLHHSKAVKAKKGRKRKSSAANGRGKGTGKGKGKRKGKRKGKVGGKSAHKPKASFRRGFSKKQFLHKAIEKFRAHQKKKVVDQGIADAPPKGEAGAKPKGKAAAKPKGKAAAKPKGKAAAPPKGKAAAKPKAAPKSVKWGIPGDMPQDALPPNVDSCPKSYTLTDSLDGSLVPWSGP